VLTISTTPNPIRNVHSIQSFEQQLHCLGCTWGRVPYNIKQSKTKQHYGTEYHPPTHPMKHTSLVLSAERTRAHATSNFVSMDYIYLHTQKRVLRDRSPRRQTRGRLDDDALTKFHHAEMDCQVSDDSFLPSKPFEYNIITDARGTTQQSWDMPLG
jgi:hypothetical protein